MINIKLLNTLLVIILLSVLMSACTNSGSGDPAQVVVAYLNALIQKDENKLLNHSCAEWEASARQELNSFAAVSANLDSPDCQVNGEEEGYTLVQCSGKIIANYGAEDLEIPLGERTFQVLNEAGEWRMCGYR